MMNKVTYYIVDLYGDIQKSYRNDMPVQAEFITVDHPLAKKALKKYSRISNFFKSVNHDNICADLVRLYILSKKKYACFIDADIVMFDLSILQKEFDDRPLFYTHSQYGVAYTIMYSGNCCKMFKRLLRYYPKYFEEALRNHNHSRSIYDLFVDESITARIFSEDKTFKKYNLKRFLNNDCCYHNSVFILLCHIKNDEVQCTLNEKFFSSCYKNDEIVLITDKVSDMYKYRNYPSVFFIHNRDFSYIPFNLKLNIIK